MVFFSYAIVDPLAVMVKFAHATVANVAMSGITSENCFACRTEAVSIEFFN
jgi:hypothetical protein